MTHDVTIREEIAGIHVVECSCGYAVGAPFGEWQAAKIVDRHLAAAGYRPTPRGSLYQ